MPRAKDFQVDITMLGDAELSRTLRKLRGPLQARIVRKALRASARRTKARLIESISRAPSPQPKTGRLLNAYKAQKIKTDKPRRRGGIRLGIPFPTREQLGIAEDDKSFYPAALEYGHGDVPAYPFHRPAIDKFKDEEIRVIGKDIGKDIVRLARK